MLNPIPASCKSLRASSSRLFVSVPQLFRLYHFTAPMGLVQPLPIPTVPGSLLRHVSMDLITDLPPSNGFDAITMFVDRLSASSLCLVIKMSLHPSWPSCSLIMHSNGLGCRLTWCLIETQGYITLLAISYGPDRHYSVHVYRIPSSV